MKRKNTLAPLYKNIKFKKKKKKIYKSVGKEKNENG